MLYVALEENALLQYQLNVTAKQGAILVSTSACTQENNAFLQSLLNTAVK